MDVFGGSTSERRSCWVVSGGWVIAQKHLRSNPVSRSIHHGRRKGRVPKRPTSHGVFVYRVAASSKRLMTGPRVAAVGVFTDRHTGWLQTSIRHWMNQGLQVGNPQATLRCQLLLGRPLKCTM